MGTKEDYIEIEKLELEDLEKVVSNLEKKWFKGEGVRQEIEFLKFYIKHKQNLINQISDNHTNGK